MARLPSLTQILGAHPMLSLEDCIALSDLTPEEVDAIAEHEHLPEVIAAELGCYLVHCADGRQAIKAVIRDDIEAARARGDFRRAGELKLVLSHFIERCRRDPALCGGWIGPAGSRL
jgi:hypothetical protein